MAGKQQYPDAESHDRLRRIARALIDHGVPLPGRSGSLSVEALQMLYQRASNPDSAADAIKLLHELQTYQVELDLLYEQLQDNEQDISEELDYYRSLYEQAPAAYLIVATEGEIIEANQAAGVLFGESTTDLAGKELSSLLAPGQEDKVAPLLRHAGEQDTASASVELTDHRHVIISARADGDNTLMILTETATHSATP